MARTRLKNQRKLSNFLLDSSFQLRHVGYSVAIAAVVGAIGAAALWRSEKVLIRQAEVAVQAREGAANEARELGRTALTRKLLGRFDDPTFERVLREQSQEIDARFEAERQAIAKDRQALVGRERTALAALAAAFLAFVALVALAMIVVTHRIAGPVYRFRVLAEEVGKGRLPKARALRGGDELQTLHSTFTWMIGQLRERESGELEKLEKALAAARAGAPADVVAALEPLRDEKRERIAGGSQAPAPSAEPGRAALSEQSQL